MLKGLGMRWQVTVSQGLLIQAQVQDEIVVVRKSGQSQCRSLDQIGPLEKLIVVGDRNLSLEAIERLTRNLGHENGIWLQRMSLEKVAYCISERIPPAASDDR